MPDSYQDGVGVWRCVWCLQLQPCGQDHSTTHGPDTIPTTCDATMSAEDMQRLLDAPRTCAGSFAAPAPTHYCDWDAPGKYRVRALCGEIMKRREHVNEPTCPDCRKALDYRAWMQLE